MAFDGLASRVTRHHSTVFYWSREPALTESQEEPAEVLSGTGRGSLAVGWHFGSWLPRPAHSLATSFSCCFVPCGSRLLLHPFQLCSFVHEPLQLLTIPLFDFPDVRFISSFLRQLKINYTLGNHKMGISHPPLCNGRVINLRGMPTAAPGSY